MELQLIERETKKEDLVVFTVYVTLKAILTSQIGGPHNSSAGSPYFTHGYSYEFDSHTNQRPALEFPAVPFVF